MALQSGIVGLIAVGFLIAALVAPTPTVGGMRRETDWFRWQDAGVILQALLMMPVVYGVHQLLQGRTSGNGRVGLGLFAQATLVLTSVLIFTHITSDMLYMAPMGLVGLWLLLVNNQRHGLWSRPLMWTGRVAGAGLLLIGIGLLIFGLTVAPAVFVRPLTTAEIDAQTLTPGNLIAHVCMAVGTLLGRLAYPVWTLLVSRALTRDVMND